MVASVELVEIGDHCMFANGCFITDGNHRFDDLETPVTWQGFSTKGPTRVGDNVWCGANVVIASGVTVGERCVIGANSVVTKDLPPLLDRGGSPGEGAQGRPRGRLTPGAASGRSRYASTCTITLRSRGRSSKSTRTSCCQVPVTSRPSRRGMVSDGPDDRRPDVGVRVRVVVQLVVAVRVVGRDQAVEHGPQVVHAARLELHRGDRRGGAGNEEGDGAVASAGRGDEALDAPRQVDDVAVALGGEAELAGVDGHRRDPTRRPMNGRRAGSRTVAS